MSAIAGNQRGPRVGSALKWSRRGGIEAISSSRHTCIASYPLRVFVYDRGGLNGYGVVYAARFKNKSTTDTIRVRVWLGTQAEDADTGASCNASTTTPSLHSETSIGGGDDPQAIVDVALEYAHIATLRTLIIGDSGTVACHSFGESIVVWSLCTGCIVGCIQLVPACISCYSVHKMWERDSVLFVVDTTLSTLQLVYWDKATGPQYHRRQIVMSGKEVAHIEDVVFDQSPALQYAIVIVNHKNATFYDTRLWWVPLYAHSTDSLHGYGMEYAVLLRPNSTSYDTVDREYNTALNTYHALPLQSARRYGMHVHGVTVPALSADRRSIIVDQRVHMKATMCARGIVPGDACTYDGYTYKLWAQGSEVRAVIQKLSGDHAEIIKARLPQFLASMQHPVPLSENVYHMDTTSLSRIQTKKAFAQKPDGTFNVTVEMNTALISVQGITANKTKATHYYCAHALDTPLIVTGNSVCTALAAVDTGMRVYELERVNDAMVKRGELLLYVL